MCLMLCDIPLCSAAAAAAAAPATALLNGPSSVLCVLCRYCTNAGIDLHNIHRGAGSRFEVGQPWAIGGVMGS